MNFVFLHKNDKNPLLFRVKISHNNKITFFIPPEPKKDLVDSKKGNNFARRMIQATKNYGK
jgi:hypothetical protein